MAWSALLLCSVVALGIFTFLGWRLASRRHSWPCPSWLSWLIELDSPFFAIARARTIVQHLNLQAGMKVLDAGCGPGRLTIPLAQSVRPTGEVVAIDSQPDMLVRAQQKARQANLSNISFRKVELGKDELAGAQFDRAVMVTVLGEIPDRQGALKEVFQALKPGGLLSVTEVISDPHFQGRNTVRKLAGSVGFREKDFRGNRFAFSMLLERPFDHDDHGTPINEPVARS